MRERKKEESLQVDNLIASITCLSNNELAVRLEALSNDWNGPRTDMTLWVPLLRHFDIELGKICQTLNTSKFPAILNAEDERFCVAVLKFSWVLLERGSNRHVYMSMDHVHTLLQVINTSVVLEASRVVLEMTLRLIAKPRDGAESDLIMARLRPEAGRQVSPYQTAWKCIYDIRHDYTLLSLVSLVLPNSSSRPRLVELANLETEFAKELSRVDFVAKTDNGEYRKVVISPDEIAEGPLDALLQKHSVGLCLESYKMLLCHLRYAKAVAGDAELRFQITAIQCVATAITVVKHTGPEGEFDPSPFNSLVTKSKIVQLSTGENAVAQSPPATPGELFNYVAELATSSFMPVGLKRSESYVTFKNLQAIAIKYLIDTLHDSECIPVVRRSLLHSTGSLGYLSILPKILDELKNDSPLFNCECAVRQIRLLSYITQGQFSTEIVLLLLQIIGTPTPVRSLAVKCEAAVVLDACLMDNYNGTQSMLPERGISNFVSVFAQQVEEAFRATEKPTDLYFNVDYTLSYTRVRWIKSFLIVISNVLRHKPSAETVSQLMNSTILNECTRIVINMDLFGWRVVSLALQTMAMYQEQEPMTVAVMNENGYAKQIVDCLPQLLAKKEFLIGPAARFTALLALSDEVDKNIIKAGNIIDIIFKGIRNTPFTDYGALEGISHALYYWMELEPHLAPIVVTHFKDLLGFIVNSQDLAENMPTASNVLTLLAECLKLPQMLVEFIDKDGIRALVGIVPKHTAQMTAKLRDSIRPHAGFGTILETALRLDIQTEKVVKPWFEELNRMASQARQITATTNIYACHWTSKAVKNALSAVSELNTLLLGIRAMAFVHNKNSEYWPQYAISELSLEAYDGLWENLVDVLNWVCRLQALILSREDSKLIEASWPAVNVYGDSCTARQAYLTSDTERKATLAAELLKLREGEAVLARQLEQARFQLSSYKSSMRWFFPCVALHAGSGLALSLKNLRNSLRLSHKLTLALVRMLSYGKSREESSWSLHLWLASVTNIVEDTLLGNSGKVVKLHIYANFVQNFGMDALCDALSLSLCNKSLEAYRYVMDAPASNLRDLAQKNLLSLLAYGLTEPWVISSSDSLSVIVHEQPVMLKRSIAVCMADLLLSAVQIFCMKLVPLILSDDILGIEPEASTEAGYIVGRVLDYHKDVSQSCMSNHQPSYQKLVWSSIPTSEQYVKLFELLGLSHSEAADLVNKGKCSFSAIEKKVPGFSLEQLSQLIPSEENLYATALDQQFVNQPLLEIAGLSSYLSDQLIPLLSKANTAQIFMLVRIFVVLLTRPSKLQGDMQTSTKDLELPIYRVISLICSQSGLHANVYLFLALIIDKCSKQLSFELTFWPLMGLLDREVLSRSFDQQGSLLVAHSATLLELLSKYEAMFMLGDPTCSGPSWHAYFESRKKVDLDPFLSFLADSTRFDNDFDQALVAVARFSALYSLRWPDRARRLALSGKLELLCRHIKRLAGNVYGMRLEASVSTIFKCACEGDLQSHMILRKDLQEWMLFENRSSVFSTGRATSFRKISELEQKVTLPLLKSERFGKQAIDRECAIVTENSKKLTPPEIMCKYLSEISQEAVEYPYVSFISDGLDADPAAVSAVLGLVLTTLSNTKWLDDFVDLQGRHLSYNELDPEGPAVAWSKFRELANNSVFMTYMASALLESSPEFRSQLMRDDSFSIYSLVRAAGRYLFVCSENHGATKESAVMVQLFQSVLRFVLAWLSPCCTEAYKLSVGKSYIRRATLLFEEVSKDLNQLCENFTSENHATLEQVLYSATKLCLTVLGFEDIQWAQFSKHPVLPQIFQRCNLTNTMFRCLGKLSFEKVSKTLKQDLQLVMQRYGNPVLTLVQTSTQRVSESLFSDDHSPTSQSEDDGNADTEFAMDEDAMTDGDDDDYVLPVPDSVPGRRRSSLSTEAFRNSTLGLFTEDGSQDEDDIEEIREQSDPQFDEISDDEVMSDVSDENMLSDIAEHEAAVSDFWDDFVPETAEGEELEFGSSQESAEVEFNSSEYSEFEGSNAESGLESDTEDESEDNVHYINIDIVEETSDEGDSMSEATSFSSDSIDEDDRTDRLDPIQFDLFDQLDFPETSLPESILGEQNAYEPANNPNYYAQLEKMFDFFQKDLTNSLVPAKIASSHLKHQNVLIRGASLIHPLHLKTEGRFLDEDGSQTPYFAYKIILVSQGHSMNSHMKMFYGFNEQRELKGVVANIVHGILHTAPRLEFAVKAIELERNHIKDSGYSDQNSGYWSSGSSEESSLSDTNTETGSSHPGSGSDSSSESVTMPNSETDLETRLSGGPENSQIDPQFLRELPETLRREVLAHQGSMASGSAIAESSLAQRFSHLAEFFNTLAPDQRQTLIVQLAKSLIDSKQETDDLEDMERRDGHLADEEVRHAFRVSILNVKDNAAEPGTYAKWQSSGLKSSRFYKLNSKRHDKWLDKGALSAFLLLLYDPDVPLRRLASNLSILPKHSYHGQMLMAILQIGDAASKGKSNLLACYKSLQEDASQARGSDTERATKFLGNISSITPSAVLTRVLQTLSYWSGCDREFLPMISTLTSTKPPKEHVFNILIKLMDTSLVSGSESLLHLTAKLVASIASHMTSPTKETSDGQEVVPRRQTPQTTRLTKLFPAHSVSIICAVPAYSEAVPAVFDEIITCLRAFVKFKDGFSLIKAQLSEKAAFYAATAAEALQPLLNASENELPEKLNSFIQPSSAQTKLLRVLTATSFALDPENLTEVEKATITAKSYSDMLLALIAMPAWPLLSEVLSRAQADYSPVPAALLPLIECVALLSKLIYTFERRANSRISRKPHALAEFGYKHRKILNRLVKSNPKLLRGNFTVFTKDPQIFEFENKQAYFVRKTRKEKRRLTELLGNTNHSLTLTVDRETVFLDSFRKLFPREPDQLKAASVKIVFRGEEGVDEGGLSREWYDLLSKQIFDPQYALFKQLEGNSSIYQPSSTSSVNPDHLLYFKFVGRIIGKAVFDGQYMDCYFSRALYKYLLGKPVSLDDMEPVDSSYHQSLCWMLENDITGVIDETFSVESEEFGVKKLYELKPNGANIAVDETNKAEYVKLIVQHVLVKGVEQQLEHLKQGFTEIVSQKLLALFDEQELELLISGLPDIDIDDWRQNTRYEGYTASSPQIRWFWRAIASFDQEERARVLQFATGTSRVPPRGMAYLGNSQGNNKFEIARDRGSTNRWPTAHTCMNAIVLPSYESYEKLREMLLRAVSNGNASGFGLA